MADADRPKSAIIRRHEQLENWKGSEWDKQPDVRPESKIKVKFQPGCVFLAACATGDTKEVKKLLGRKADINYANVDGLTALHQAVIDENQDMVEFLLENGANIESQDNEGWTPLHAAASCGFVDIASFLLENGANVCAVNNEGEIPLDLAEEEEMEDFLDEEIEKAGIDAEEARNEEESIMLKDANQWLNSKIVKDKKHPKTGASSLHVAAAKGYIKVMEILIQAGLGINAKDSDGWTPLHAASHWGHKEAVELLAENMADFDAKNNLGQTAFDLADEDDDMLPYLTEQKKKQASGAFKMKRDDKPTAPRIDGRVPPPLKRRSSVTRISIPDRNSLIHQDMFKERKELESKLAGKDQDKKTMESSSSESETETESSSEEESDEEEEEEKKVILPPKKAAPAPVKKPPPTITPLNKPVAPPPSQKKELPSFSPKPLDPKKDKKDSNESDTPAWRTGLRKTGSEIMNPADTKKQQEKDKLSRSASAPKMSDQKPPAPWENQRKVGDASKKPDDSANKSVMTPAKNEEAEINRKSRARYERSTRRSTQGVSAEDIESAVSTLRNKNGEDKGSSQDNKLAEEEEEDKGRSTDRFSRSASASAVGSRDSSSSVLDKYGSRGDKNSSTGSAYSSRDKDKASSTPCSSCKKLCEDKESTITKLQKEIKEKDAEIAELKRGGGSRGVGGSADNDKREKRALERRISELEEELKGVAQLKADNQRLKDENGALVRVISKLSK